MPNKDDNESDRLEHWLNEHVTPARLWSNVGPVQIVVLLAALLLVVWEMLHVGKMIWRML
jgi:hypothetical protein